MTKPARTDRERLRERLDNLNDLQVLQEWNPDETIFTPMMENDARTIGVVLMEIDADEAERALAEDDCAELRARAYWRRRRARLAREMLPTYLNTPAEA